MREQWYGTLDAMPERAGVVFAAWTLAANLAYASELSLFAGCMIFVAILVLFVLVLQGLRPTSSETKPRDGSEHPDHGELGWLRISLVVLSIVLVVRVSLFPSFLTLWFGGLVILGGSTVVLLREKGAVPLRKEDIGASALMLVLLLSIGGALLALAARRPDADDCYYMSRAAYLAEHFFTAMPHHYTLFPGSSTPFPYPSFPLMALHDGIGALSWVTGLEPMEVNAFLLAPFGAVLCVLAYTGLLRTLLGRSWSWGLVAVFIILVSEGTTHRSFGNFSFVRIWQGKALLLHVGLPVLLRLALRFGDEGGKGNGLRLAMGQVALLGLSSTSVWLGPVVGGLGVVSGSMGRPEMMKRVAGFLLTCAYPLGIGLWAYQNSFQAFAHATPQAELLPVWLDVFGPLAHAAMWVGVMFMAALIGGTAWLRRYATLAGLVFWGMFANPFLATYISRYVTSPPVFWRILWILPFPVLFAGVATAGFSLPLRRAPYVGKAWMAAMLVFFALLLPSRFVFSKENSVHLGWPTVKIDPQDLAVARYLHGRLPTGAKILAPEPISWIIPTYRWGLYAVAPRWNVINYTVRYQFEDKTYYQQLSELFSYVEGKGELDSDIMRRYVKEQDLGAVVVVQDAKDKERLHDLLAVLGFRQKTLLGYEIFVRK
jgi:hypothetical protein